MKKTNIIVMMIAYVVLMAVGITIGISVVLIVLKGWWDMLVIVAVAITVAAYALMNIIEES